MPSRRSAELIIIIIMINIISMLLLLLLLLSIDELLARVVPSWRSAVRRAWGRISCWYPHYVFINIISKLCQCYYGLYHYYYFLLISCWPVLCQCYYGLYYCYYFLLMSCWPARADGAPACGAPEKWIFLFEYWYCVIITISYYVVVITIIIK